MNTTQHAGDWVGCQLLGQWRRCLAGNTHCLAEWWTPTIGRSSKIRNNFSNVANHHMATDMLRHISADSLSWYLLWRYGYDGICAVDSDHLNWTEVF